MSNFFKNLFESEEKTPLHKIAFSLFGLVIIREFLENFSSPDYTGYFFPLKDSFFHFPIYYTSVFLSFALLLFFFTKKSLQQILNFEIKIFLFILIPPIVDLIATGGNGSLMAYVTTTPKDFIAVFFQLMNPLGFAGITLGIHAAAYLIIFSLAIFVYKATHKLTKALFTIIASYTVLVIYAIIPSFIAIPELLASHSSSASTAYATTLKNSWLITTQEHASAPLAAPAQFQDAHILNYFFSSPLTQLFFLFTFIQLLLLFIVYYPKLWITLKKSLRPERLVFWFSISLIGFFMAQNIFGNINFLNPINIISLLAFLLLIALNIWLAICINDSEDIVIDTISNPTRPLITKEFTNIQWQKLQLFLLSLILFGTATMNHTVAYFLILAQMSYYIYSAKPLRLKRHFLSSSILVGVAAIAIAMAGFFLVSPDQHISAYPIQAIFIIGISFALISNFKDLKDFEGDKHEGIKTMPVVFGIENSKRFIAALFALTIIGLPIMLKTFSMLFLSICTSLFLYYLLTKKQYQEKYIFLVLYLYLFSFLLFLNK